MNQSYRFGVGLGVILLVAVWWFGSSRFTPGQPLNVAFENALYDQSEAPILHDKSRTVVLKLENRGSRSVRVDDVQLSHTFARLGSEVKLPLRISPRSHVEIPVEITAERGKWGPYETKVTAMVSNQKITAAVSAIVLCDVASYLNFDPPIVQFDRVKRSGTIPPQTVRVWSVASEPSEADCPVASVDPAVTVSARPINLVEKGRRYQWELTIQIDARQAQPEHRSQIVVPAQGDRPAIILPVAGWVDNDE